MERFRRFALIVLVMTVLLLLFAAWITPMIFLPGEWPVGYAAVTLFLGLAWILSAKEENDPL